MLITSHIRPSNPLKYAENSVCSIYPLPFCALGVKNGSKCIFWSRNYLHMRRITLLLALLSTLALAAVLSMGFRSQTVMTDAEIEAELQGAWRMVLRNGAVMEDLQLEMVKIIQDGYFMFAFYQEATQSFYSAGGGTYTVRDGQYREDIRFHTIDPKLVGTYVNFDIRLEGDRWFHEGVVSGEDLKEVFERADADGTPSLAGAWICTAHSQANGDLHALRERDPQTWKLVTDQHFQWVTFDGRTGDLLGCSGGTFEWDEGIYAEDVAFHMQDTMLTGHRLIWPSQIEGETWTQTTPLSRGSEAPQRQIWRRMK